MSRLTKKVFRSAQEHHWHEHRERCQAAIGQVVHVRFGQSQRTAATLLSVGRTRATVRLLEESEPEQVGLDQVELP
jgi:hypothetical protein